MTLRLLNERQLAELAVDALVAVIARSRGGVLVLERADLRPPRGTTIRVTLAGDQVEFRLESGRVQLPADCGEESALPPYHRAR
jgi:hypothetical protein